MWSSESVNVHAYFRCSHLKVAAKIRKTVIYSALCRSKHRNKGLFTAMTITMKKAITVNNLMRIGKSKTFQIK